jgi:hypothetical protein
MARRAAFGFEAVRVEGSLIVPDFLARVAALDADHQDSSAYHLPRGLSVRDEIGRAWRIGEAHWQEVLRHESVRGTKRIRAVLALLRDAFGWTSLEPVSAPLVVAERAYPITAQALGGTVPVIVAEDVAGLDGADPRYGDGTRRRSPFGLAQEYLNASEGALWAVVTDGRILRIVRDNASLTRPAWIEIDLARICGEQRYADFSLCWLLLHASRFGGGGTPPSECVLEGWRSAAIEAGAVARDRLRDGVEAALRSLGRGFLAHSANTALRAQLTSGSLDAAGYQQQLLRVVYRIIFLLVAEERELLHPAGSTAEARAAYRDGYGMQRLRERSAKRRAYDRHDDAWDSLQVAIRGCAAGEPRLGLPGLGGLFAASQCPDLDQARLGNRELHEAVFRLTWLPQDDAVVRVNWRDMGTEELGSVYESLLELVPEVGEGGWTFGFVGDPVAGAEDGGTGATTGGNARKLTGSYYTPDSLVQALLDSALEPVIARVLTEQDPEAALLRLSVLDPAMGSGHFLLGAARRIAGHLVRQRVDGTPGPDVFRRALRDVVTHCVYGSDKNAMAVELARIALWLEAMEPGRPLAFLDHHLVHGDAILGVLDSRVLAEGIPGEAFAPLTGDDRVVASALKRANAADLRALRQEREQLSIRFDTSALAQGLSAVDALPDSTIADIEAKREALARVRQEQHDAAFRFACDAFVAAFLLRKDRAGKALVPTTGTLRNLAIGIEPAARMREVVDALARAVPFLHWPIAFAPVMARGGFDCVLGNPPWEKVKLSEKEFFASRDPAIATAQNAAARERMIEALGRTANGTAARRLFDAFEQAKQEAEGTSRYARHGGRFPLTGSGDVNLYSLFAETALGLVHAQGRAGLVLPSGVASDAGTAPFFRHVADGRLASLIDFENREALFAGVHRSYKFCLFTIGATEAPTFAFFLTRPEQRFDQRRRFTLSAEDLRRLNPNTGNAPVFRSRADAELTAKIYRNVPVLWDETREDGNPWELSFGTLFHMSNDSGLFRTAPGKGLVPLYEAKMIHQFDHRWATYADDGADGARDVTEEEKQRVDYEVRPRYWVPEAEVRMRLEAKGWTHPWLLGWRDICRATDERTVISAVVPALATGDPVLLAFPGRDTAATDSLLLLADFNSLVHDYVARQKVGGTHLKFFTKKQIATLPPSAYGRDDLQRICQSVAALVLTSRSLQPFAKALRDEGVLSSPTIRPTITHDERRRRVAELDATYARLYGLSRDDLEFVLDPQAALASDYPTETFRVLKNKEQSESGEFRTKRLVLEAWDRLFGT